jgi:hypothetical protein
MPTAPRMALHLHGAMQDEGDYIERHDGEGNTSTATAKMCDKTNCTDSTQSWPASAQNCTVSTQAGWLCTVSAQIPHKLAGSAQNLHRYHTRWPASAHIPQKLARPSASMVHKVGQLIISDRIFLQCSPGYTYLLKISMSPQNMNTYSRLKFQMSAWTVQTYVDLCKNTNNPHVPAPTKIGMRRGRSLQVKTHP